MSNSGRSGVIGGRLWVLSLLVFAMFLSLEATLTAFQGRGRSKPPPGFRGNGRHVKTPAGFRGGRLGGNMGRQFGSIGSGRRLPASGSGRRMGSLGSGRNLPSAGFGRKMADPGAGRRLADVGGAKAPSLPTAPTGPRHGGGTPLHGIPRSIVVWPEAQQPIDGGPDPIDPVAEAEPQPFSSPAEITESDANVGVTYSLPAPQPMEDLADRLASTGREQLRQGEVYLAESSLNSAVGLFPSDPIMRVEYALALAAVQNYSGAMTQLIDSFRLAPELVVESLNVVAAYGGQERFDELMEQIDRYRAAFRLDSNSLFLRAFLALHSGALEEARRDFLLLRSNDPKFPFLSAFTQRLSLLELTLPVATEPPQGPAEPGQEEPELDAGDDSREAPDGPDR